MFAHQDLQTLGMKLTKIGPLSNFHTLGDATSSGGHLNKTTTTHNFHVDENYSHLFNLRSNVCKPWYLNTHFIPNNSDLNVQWNRLKTTIVIYGHIPANTKHMYNNSTMSVQHLRRWFSIVQMLYKCFVLAGIGPRDDIQDIVIHHLDIDTPPLSPLFTVISMITVEAWVFQL